MQNPQVIKRNWCFTEHYLQENQKLIGSELTNESALGIILEMIERVIDCISTIYSLYFWWP